MQISDVLGIYAVLTRIFISNIAKAKPLTKPGFVLLADGGNKSRILEDVKGTRILNAALADAEHKFEEKETVRLVNREYVVLQAEESDDFPPIQSPSEDDDYEFV